MVVKRTENEALWVNVRPDDPDICDYLENCLLPNSLYIIDPNLYWMITFLRTSEIEKATRPLVHYELPSHHIPVSLLCDDCRKQMKDYPYKLMIFDSLQFIKHEPSEEIEIFKTLNDLSLELGVILLLFTHRRADKKMLRNHYHNYVSIVRYLPNA